MRRKFLYASLFMVISILLAACVTINIYFPAAAAEKAADKIIEEVWQLENANEGIQGIEKTNPDD